MQLLTKIDHPVLLQVVCDALDDQNIKYRVDGSFSTAMGPGIGLFTPRVMVEARQLELAEQVLIDLDIERDTSPHV